MTGSRSSNEDKPGQINNTDGEDSDDEESEILEESPCGRWVKRREEVSTINLGFVLQFKYILLVVVYYYEI